MVLLDAVASSPSILAALESAGPWLTVAAICIVLLGAITKVVVVDHAMVPFSLLEQERGRTEKALEAFDKVVGAVDQLTLASSQVLPLVQDVRDQVREMGRDIDDLRREVRGCR